MAITVGSRTFADADALEKLVIHAATEYDINGYSEDFDGQEITDPEYDALYRKLQEVKPKSIAFQGTSPSTAKPTGDTVTHDPPMTSIAKADGTVDEKKAVFKKWVEDCAKRLGTTPAKLLKELAISYKRDGCAARFNYVNGKLVSAGQRPRDGVNGTDITRHCKYLQGVPMELTLPLTLSLNGEVECWLDDFDKVNADQDAAGEDAYKNPRNFTAGCLGRDDPKELKNARLRATFHSVTGFDEWDQYYKTEIERAKWINSNDGLGLNDNKGKGCYVQTRRFDPKHFALMEEYASKLPYYTDGIVVKIDVLEDQFDLGHVGDDTVNAPRGAIAYKYKEETAESEVTGVEWKASRTGRVVPTATFDTPFVLADTENSRATCNNYGWMKGQGLGPGAKVRCKKGGKIIPNIMEVLVPVDDVGAPTHCPSCQTKLLIFTSSSGNKDLRCDNEDCPAKHIHSWLFYLQNLQCKGIGAAAMEIILNSGKVTNLADLYDLTIDDLVTAGFSERQALLALACIFKVRPVKNDKKLLASINDARQTKLSVPAWQFFAALGIPGAGKTVGKALVAYFKNFDGITLSSEDNLEVVDGIGHTTAVAIVEYFEIRRGVVQKLLDRHVELEMPKFGKLSNKNFALTGGFDLGKSHWEKKIQDQGGNTQSSVGSKTHYLIQQNGKSDGSPSAKEEKAVKLGVMIISVGELEKMLAPVAFNSSADY